MNILKTIIKFARIRVTVMLFALSFLGSGGGGGIGVKLLLVFPILVAWYIHATTTNDYADYEIDRVNLKKEKDRPLLTDALTKSGLWRIHLVALLSTMALSFTFGVKGLILSTVMIVIDYAYSLRPIRVSDRGIIAQYLLAFAYTYFPLSLGYWSSPANYSFPWLLSFGIFSSFIARLLLKDFRDVRGDRQYGKMTFLLRHGPKVTTLTSAGYWFLSIIFISLYTSFAYGVIVPLVVGFIQVCLLLSVLYQAKSVARKQNSIIFISKAVNALIMALLAFLLLRNHLTITVTELVAIPAIVGISLLTLNWLRYRAYHTRLA